jgi:hypothetical protein
MKLVSFKWNEIILISPEICWFFKKVFRTTRLPRGIAFWPFLIIRDEEEFKRPWLINHERIHLVQDGNLLVVGAFLLQLVEILYARAILKLSRAESYYFQSAEQEAYLNQHNLNYLKTRPLFAQFKYIRNKKRFRVTSTPGELEFY